jgi:hypothetical protein
MKGQYLVVQFLLFFLIGLSIFLGVGNLFRYQADAFGASVADSYRKLLNSYISSAIIYGFSNCKQCDNVTITLRIKNETAEYFYEVYYTSSGLNIISQPGGKKCFVFCSQLQLNPKLNRNLFRFCKTNSINY